MKKKVAGPLSHSSAKTLLSCEQKYWHYKINNTPVDSDYDLSDALSVGKAFHYVQEVSKHEKVSNISELLDHCQRDPEILLDNDARCLVHAMSVKYWRLHKNMGLTPVAIEVQVGDEDTVGYVDVVLADKEGNWWIVDLKANRNLYLPGVNSLPKDPQLNLYAYFAPKIAEMYNLDIDKFMGTKWRVVTKPALKRKSEESDLEYTKRIIKVVRAYDIDVPLRSMEPNETKQRHDELYKLSDRLHKKTIKPKKNFGSCMAYFRPCEYWSQCHGKNFSEIELNIFEEV